MTVYLTDLLSKLYTKYVKSIKIDLVCDALGHLYILKVKELSLTDLFINPSTLSKGLARTVTNNYEYSIEEVSIEEENQNFTSKILNEQRKKDSTLKIHLRKKAPINSADFLEMIANTIDKQRKTQASNDFFSNKKNPLGIENKQTFSKIQSFKSTQDLLSSKKNLSSINDLLFYLEKTRPKIWVKDNQRDDSQSELVSSPDLNSVKREESKDCFYEHHRVHSRIKVNSFNTCSRPSNSLYQQKLMKFLSDEENRLKVKCPNLKVKNKACYHPGSKSIIKKTELFDCHKKCKSGLTSPLFFI